jgi:hypothetical protein
MTYSLLSKFAYEISKRYDRLTRALSACGEGLPVCNSRNVAQMGNSMSVATRG